MTRQELGRMCEAVQADLLRLAREAAAHGFEVDVRPDAQITQAGGVSYRAWSVLLRSANTSQ